MSYRDIEPVWVLVNGELRNVSDFASLQPTQRPDAVCPVCNASVVMKLGKQRIHHYAHKTDGPCATHEGESALHLNTKFYLYTQLRTAHALTIEQPCTARPECRNVTSQVWVRNWDAIAVEYRLDPYRPDIALFRQGTIIAAVEIVVSHPVGEQKERFFREEQIPWIEVNGSYSVYSGRSRWFSNQPLRIRGGRGSIPAWQCDACTTAQEEERQLREQRQRWIAERMGPQTTVLDATVVDLYYPTGRQVREIYIVFNKQYQGADEHMGVKTAREEVIAWVHPPYTPESKTELMKRVSDRLIVHQKRRGIVEDRIAWHPCSDVPALQRQAARLAWRYRWDDQSRFWMPADESADTSTKVVDVSKSDGRIPAAVAWKVAERLRERLAATCIHFEVAGSLRRQKPTVGDVDIVCVPVLEEPPGMLPGLGHAEPVSFTREVDAIVAGSNGAISYEVNGEAIKRLIIRLKDGTRVMADIYFTRDLEQFPALLLIRTGSARHNAYLSGLARDQGMQLGSDGLKRGDQRVHCATEAEIFEHLGLGYREPHMREFDDTED